MYDLTALKTGRRLLPAKPQPAPSARTQPDRLAEQLAAPALPTAPPDPNRLAALARQSLPEGTSYSRSEAVALILAATNVSAERAERGLDLMLEQGVLQTTPTQTIYLSGTVPF